MDFEFNDSFLCFHPSFLDKKCTLCNLPIIACGNGLITTPLSYIHPNLALTLEEVDRVRDDNLRHLLQSKKLHLVLDLDHTLIDSRLTKNVTLEEKQRLTCTKDVYNMLSCRYVKLRPGVREFIKQVSSMFDLSIYTMADKVYAQEVRGLLESKAGFPRLSWVIAKQDCTKYRQKRMDVVLSHERVVLIVDDTKNIWGDFCTENLVKINRYEFFPIKEQQEEEIDTELARVFGVLKMVHDKFYDVDFEVEDEVVFGTRDVR
ncbi:RNA polymerase II C-terminal domain phosphatase-like 4 [Chenopodium quinoa]|uniref:protein-serine/threonine phosphatase n=1 Tax=Chenopodium quinoa TaxID=63459 RepID=A0A803MR02_CHEQI|nr:RNA polymerase II C-terminal domain phosphatase-like 4 [Chenopodium quinoa]